MLTTKIKYIILVYITKKKYKLKNLLITER